MRNYSNGQVQRATSIIKGLNYHAPRLPRPVSKKNSKDKYTAIWTFRGIMLLRMEQAGMKSLPLGGITLDKFAIMSPDQKGHVDKLIAANRATVSSVKQLVALCDNPRPEILSCVCCFAGDKCFDSLDLDTIDIAAWARMRKQLKRSHGMTPHVAQVCKKMLGKD